MVTIGIIFQDRVDTRFDIQLAPLATDTTQKRVDAFRDHQVTAEGDITGIMDTTDAIHDIAQLHVVDPEAIGQALMEVADLMLVQHLRHTDLCRR